MKKKDNKKAAAKPTEKKTRRKNAPATPQAATPERTPMDIQAAMLRHAPWNPRAKITPDSVADLTASIRKDGLIQRLVVVRDGEKYIVVAGNRRLVACRAAGLDPIPCEVMAVTQDQARRLTLLENLQRQDVDPILESELIEKLIADGMTQAEIAAETGRGERWVARRKNLKNLAPVWRDHLAKGAKITTDCLERIAAYPHDIQSSAEKSINKWAIQNGLRWSMIADTIRRMSRSLDETPFCRSCCTKCPNNSANAPLLFADDDDKPVKYGKCLDGKCYERHCREHAEAEIAKADHDGRTVVHVKNEYDVPSSLNTSPRRDDKHPVLYVFKDFSGNTVARWGVEEPKSESKPEGDAEEARKAKLATRERNKAIRSLAEWCAKDDNLYNCIVGRFGDAATNGIMPWVPLAFQEAFIGIGTCYLVGTHTDREKVAASMIFRTFFVPLDWARWVALEIIKYLDPGRNQEYYAVPNAKLILALFKDASDGIGPAAKVAIALDDELEKIKLPEIKWLDPDKFEATNGGLSKDVGDDEYDESLPEDDED